MRKKIGALLLAASALMGGQASATTITFSGSGANGLTPFNAALGTLQSVSITTDWFAIIGFEYSAYQGPGVTVVYPIIKASGYFGYDAIGKADYSGFYQSEYFNPGNAIVTLRASSNVVRTDNLARYSQPYGLPFVNDMLPVLTFPNGTPVQSRDIGIPGGFGGGARFTVTYDYIDAIPEPATWAMMLVGFAIIGASARYRRRTVTATFG